MGFFFSSKRRHTMFKCDWSSGVCSSDLTTGESEDIEGEHDLLLSVILSQGNVFKVVAVEKLQLEVRGEVADFWHLSRLLIFSAAKWLRNNSARQQQSDHQSLHLWTPE